MDTLADVTAVLAAKSTTSRALVDAALLSARTQAHLGAFIGDTATFEASARAQADASDARRSRGAVLGPLDGVPIAIKDNILVEGAPCTAGSKILEGFTAPYDATAIAKLKGAGAVLFGRTSCDEFGMGSTTESCAYQGSAGPCKNPRDEARIPGGSSGGSAAAVAAGIVPLALGSDTGGSIRQPAAMCGVAGIKPTWGRVSRFGLVAFASSLDVIGPIASDLHGACAVLDAIAGPDPRDATSSQAPMPSLVEACARGRAQGLAGKVLGVPRALLAGEGLRDDVRSALAALEARAVAAGARVVDVELPNLPHAIAAYYVLCTAEASSNLARFDGVRYGARGDAKNLGELYENTRALFGPEVKRRIVLGSWVLSAGYYDAYVRRAQKVRRLVARDFEKALAACDAVWMPVSPEPAWLLGAKNTDPLALYLADAFTVPPSLAGLPALALNAGASGEGLPVGVQLVGRAFDEAALVALGGAVERLASESAATTTQGGA